MDLMTHQNELPLSAIAQYGKARPTYDRLKFLIRTNRLRPYEPLRPHRLAITLTSGATPVREALQRLTCESLVTWNNNRGHFSKAYDVAETTQLLNLAHALLTSSVRTHLADTAVLPDQRTAQVLFHPDYDQTVDLDKPTDMERTYQSLVVLGQNPEVERVLDNIIDRTHAISVVEANLELVHRGRSGYIRAELEAVVAAIHVGSIEDALRALSAHIQRRLRNVTECVRNANAIACGAPLP